MTRKDAPFLLVLFAAALALFAPGLVDPSLLAVNFGDLQGYHFPLRFLAAGRLQSGALPFWNPYIFAGLPMFANPQTGTLYRIPPVLDFPRGMGVYGVPYRSSPLGDFGGLSLGARRTN